MGSKAELFFEEIKNKTVAFIGIGVTNTDTIKLFLSKGIKTIACDRRGWDKLGDAAPELESCGAVMRLGEGCLDGLEADIVFRTPGMYFLSPEIETMRKRGIIVTSEMEVFFQLCPCKTIAVTGSEGKTTTTTLISKMLEAQGKKVYLGGNIGKALLPLIFEIQPEDFAAVELSSFQLISMRPSPDISLITNITPDHLDVHKGGMEEYIGAKRNIFLHQNAFSRTVLNADNDITYSFAHEIRGECMMFSLTQPVEHGAYLRDGTLIAVNHGKETDIMPASDIRLPGLHNVANTLAALCAVTGFAEKESVTQTAVTFGGVEHRLEFVREINGVKWYNDSIATAPPAVIAGLRAFDRKLIIIGGGYDKQIPFDPLAPDIIEHVKLLILTGPTASKIEAVVKNHPDYKGSPEIVMAVDIPEAVKIAHESAQSGDIISLSPACASFDAYRNFEERGRHFKELVSAL